MADSRQLLDRIQTLNNELYFAMRDYLAYLAGEIEKTINSSDKSSNKKSAPISSDKLIQKLLSENQQLGVPNIIINAKNERLNLLNKLLQLNAQEANSAFLEVSKQIAEEREKLEDARDEVSNKLRTDISSKIDNGEILKFLLEINKILSKDIERNQLDKEAVLEFQKKLPLAKISDENIEDQEEVKLPELDNIASQQTFAQTETKAAPSIANPYIKSEITSIEKPSSPEHTSPQYPPTNNSEEENTRLLLMYRGYLAEAVQEGDQSDAEEYKKMIIRLQEQGLQLESEKLIKNENIKYKPNAEKIIRRTKRYLSHLESHARELLDNFLLQEPDLSRKGKPGPENINEPTIKSSDNKEILISKFRARLNDRSIDIPDRDAQLNLLFKYEKISTLMKEINHARSTDQYKRISDIAREFANDPTNNAELSKRRTFTSSIFNNFIFSKLIPNSEGYNYLQKIKKYSEPLIASPEVENVSRMKMR